MCNYYYGNTVPTKINVTTGLLEAYVNELHAQCKYSVIIFYFDKIHFEIVNRITTT